MMKLGKLPLPANNNSSEHDGAVLADRIVTPRVTDNRDPDAALLRQQAIDAFLDSLELPENDVLVQELLSNRSANHTDQSPSSELPVLRALNARVLHLDAEITRRLGSGASSCVYELRIRHERFAFKLGYRDGDPWQEQWGMMIGRLWPNSQAYFTSVHAVRDQLAPARVVMELVGDGVSLQEMLLSGQLPAPGTPERIEWAKRVSGMMADAVIFMNKAKVYHGDFKADNIVVIGGLEAHTVKIIDWEQAVTPNTLVGGDSCGKHFKKHLAGSSSEKVGHVHKQLIQVLQLARMVACTFMDLGGLVSGDRWAVDGANIAADASFGDRWLPEHHCSLLLLTGGYYVRTRQLHWSTHVTVTLIQEAIAAHPEWFDSWLLYIESLLLLGTRKVDWSRQPEKVVEDWALPRGAVALFFGKGSFKDKMKRWREVPNNVHIDRYMLFEVAKKGGDGEVIKLLRAALDGMLSMINESLEKNYSITGR